MTTSTTSNTYVDGGNGRGQGGGGGYMAGDGITISGFTINNSAKPELVTVCTVEIIAGHVGQVRYQDRIVWQSKPTKSAARALRNAQRHVSDRVTKLFAR